MTNEALALQQFLHTHIPATAALAVQITEAGSESVTLDMPLPPNRNHKHTAFGGSIALGATTCSWALVHTRFPEAQGNIVIQQGETRYLKPATGGLTITARAGSGGDWQKMQEMFERHGKGKIELEAEVFSNGALVAVFKGKFVALK